MGYGDHRGVVTGTDQDLLPLREPLAQRVYQPELADVCQGRA